MTALLPRLFSDMTDWFDTDFPIRGGLIRVEDTLADGEYVVRAELPGLDPEKDVSLTVLDGMLRIHAERREEEQTKSRSEFRYGMMQRLLRLPAGAEEDKITATYDKGVLTVHVPISSTKTPAGRTIPVKA
jgi:HSP20 family molecular chaperone IbpA